MTDVRNDHQCNINHQSLLHTTREEHKGWIPKTKERNGSHSTPFLSCKGT